jgi:polysaccharide export outer membrane protein
LWPLVIGLAGFAPGCAESGAFVWARDLPVQPASAQATYTISKGDMLDVRVYNEERLTTHARVRSDGRITMPLLGEVSAFGKQPQNLAQELSVLLQKYLNSPVVTVSVEDARPIAVTVLGELGKPGIYTLPGDAGVLQAVALAGGLTEFADRSSIYVARSAPPLRVRFRYVDLAHNESKAVSFRLKDGDVVTVE